MSRDMLFLFLGLGALVCLIGLAVLLFGRRTGATQATPGDQGRTTDRRRPRG